LISLTVPTETPSNFRCLFPGHNNLHICIRYLAGVSISSQRVLPSNVTCLLITSKLELLAFSKGISSVVSCYSECNILLTLNCSLC
jgi:hypothetical protein